MATFLFRTKSYAELKMIYIIKIKLFYYRLVLYSETLELSWNIEPNRIQSNQIEFFKYFDVFSSSVRSNRTHRYHSNASNTSCKSIQMQ
jgi:hypothetical protein